MIKSQTPKNNKVDTEKRFGCHSAASETNRQEFNYRVYGSPLTGDEPFNINMWLIDPYAEPLASEMIEFCCPEH